MSSSRTWERDGESGVMGWRMEPRKRPQRCLPVLPSQSLVLPVTSCNSGRLPEPHLITLYHPTKFHFEPPQAGCCNGNLQRGPPPWEAEAAPRYGAPCRPRPLRWEYCPGWKLIQRRPNSGPGTRTDLASPHPHGPSPQCNLVCGLHNRTPTHLNPPAMLLGLT